MKKTFFLTFLTNLLFLGVGFCAMTISGESKFQNSSMFMDIDVQESGNVVADKTEFNALSVKGHCNLTDCLVKKDVSVYGDVLANSTKFQKISIYSGKLVLDSCTLESLYIFDAAASPLVIELKGSTVIQGPIVWETGKAIVFADETVKVLGEMKGGAFARK